MRGKHVFSTVPADKLAAIESVVGASKPLGTTPKVDMNKWTAERAEEVKNREDPVINMSSATASTVGSSLSLIDEDFSQDGNEDVLTPEKQKIQIGDMPNDQLEDAFDQFHKQSVNMYNNYRLSTDTNPAELNKPLNTAMVESNKPLVEPKPQRTMQARVDVHAADTSKDQYKFEFPKLPKALSGKSKLTVGPPMCDRFRDMTAHRANVHIATIASVLQGDQEFSYSKLDTAAFFGLVNSPPYPIDYDDLLDLAGIARNEKRSQIRHCELLTYYALYGLVLHKPSLEDFEYLFKGSLKANLLRLFLDPNRLTNEDIVFKETVREEVKK